ncbi:MAG: hypothetical protein IT371_20365 [Deltaproteobacteria bacterium]|nr:hypothetical protein [Deltaproteobacteria bacterium]
MRPLRPSHYGPVLLVAALLAPGCGEPPPATRQMQAAIVIDRTVFTFIRVFQVTVVKATTKDNASVTCSDFPARFKVGDPVLREVASKQIEWKGETTEARVTELTVPGGEKLVVLARGLAPSKGGTHAVATGCADNLTFGDQSQNQVSIDVKATTGAMCDEPGDCEAGLTCQQSAELKGGYCAKSGCAADDDCPPASRCVADAGSGGLCARQCARPGAGDCNTGPPQVQDCVSRRGPAGCVDVCAYPLWNTAGRCD